MGVGGAEVLGSLFREAGSRITEFLKPSEIGEQVLETVGSQRNEGTRTPFGMKFNTKMDEYTVQRNKILGDLVKPIQEVETAVRDNPENLNKTTIGKLHADLSARNHPAKDATAKILQGTPEAADMTLKDLNQKARSQASLLAQTQVMGVNNSKLIADIMPLYETLFLISQLINSTILLL
jgi:hypothetical protein